MLAFSNGTIVLPDRLLENASVLVREGRIEAIGSTKKADQTIDLDGGYLLPGFIDVHVHGGSGSDFMDLTSEAFTTVLDAHLRHGTTACTPTTTVASHEQHLQFLKLTRQFRLQPTGRTRVLGAHLYGPYFAPDAKGCHPGGDLRPPTEADYGPYFEYADDIRTATVAPELEGAENFVRACRAQGIRCNAGHSHATFEQVEAAVGWGVRHIDHLFCAMSDRARLRQKKAFPMRGGVMEATLYFDELTTEVIADGQHLAPSLLRLAYKIKGPDRLALVSDAMRALDMPDGEYVFGPKEGGDLIRRQGNVGVTMDGKALASGVLGMDDAVRIFLQSTWAPLPEVIRMATLTPARILGVERELGSIEVGKWGDLLVTDRDLNIREVYVAGERVR
jgi:N-acetylglucosamine-6-phosphate deacetylase